MQTECQGGCKWRVRKTEVEGSFRYRHCKCKNKDCTNTKLITIPIQYAPPQEFRGNGSMRRLTSDGDIGASGLL